MTREIWEAAAIKNHLQAVYTGQTAYITLNMLDESKAKAYKRGVDIVLRYLAHRFGIFKGQTTQTSKLRAWNREDILGILIEVRTIIQQSIEHRLDQASTNHDYLIGICHTLNAVALSFGIPEVSPIHPKFEK